MDSLLQDFRYALRQLRHSPGFTIVAVLTLALGIGATTTIFSAVRAVLIRPLPFPRDGELVQLLARTKQSSFPAFSPPTFDDIRKQNQSFTGLAAINSGSVALSGEREAEQVASAQVTGGFFAVLGVAPGLGRAIGPGDDAEGSVPIGVLGYRLWQRRFGGDPSVIGRKIMVDGSSVEIVGVMPRGFSYPLNAEFWAPQIFTANDLATQRGAYYLDVIGRLRPGVTNAQSTADVQRITTILAEQYPNSNKGLSGFTRPLRDALIGDVGTPLKVLLGAVGMVLLIACVNVANLLLVRGMRRGRELAIRTAVGATSHRLVRALLVESLVVGLLGAAAGVFLAVWGTGVIATAQGAAIPLLDQTRVDGAVLGFTLALTLGSSILFGTWPARQAMAQIDLAARFREESGTVSGGSARQRSRSILVAAQLALATILLVGAGLLLRSFQQLTRVDLGVSPNGVLTFAVGLPKNYETPERRAQFVETLSQRLAAIPGVSSSGASFFLPFSDFRYNISTNALDGAVLPQEESGRLTLQVRLVTADWFKTLGVIQRQGRGILTSDRIGAPPVAVLNESAARLVWPGGDPIGHRITLGTRFVRGGDRAGGEVVGVVADIREFGPARQPVPTIYLSYLQWPVDLVGFAARSSGDMGQLIGAARGALSSLDSSVPMYQVRTLEQLTGDVVAQPRLYAILLSLFAGAALLLAAVGVYGVLAATVAARSREIGVRIALGAERKAVVGQIITRAGLLALCGVGAGSVIALALSSVVRNLLFGVAPNDPVTFALVILNLGLATLLAAWFPAWRAARVDPLVALRSE